MSDSLLGAIVFYALAALTIGGAIWVAFSRNIVHSAFALLGTLVGTAGLYAFLAAELMVVLQIMVYVGGVLVLILFSVMLTSKISDVAFSNPSVGKVPGLIVLALLSVGSTFIAIDYFGLSSKNDFPGTIDDIGNALLGDFILPFHVVSILLFAVLVGAVGIARGIRQEDLQEKELSHLVREEDLEQEEEQVDKAQGEAA